MLSVLGFDCAGGSCSAAVLVDRQTAASRGAAMERGHAEALLPMIASVLADARIDVAALDLVAVTVGPGGFTGVRTGLATARGFALARGIPLVGVTCFEAVAEAAALEADGLPLVVALESKREELFLQCFERSRPGEPALVPPGGWASFAPPTPFALAGDGADRFAAALAREDVTAVRLDADAMAVNAARRGAAMWERGEQLLPPMPLYLRAPDVTILASDRKQRS